MEAAASLFGHHPHDARGSGSNLGAAPRSEFAHHDIEFPSPPSRGGRSLYGKSPAQSEQLYCWIGCRRIISAENRGNSCHASILPRSWHWARAAFSTRRSSKVLHAQPASLVATSKYVNAAENRVTNTGSSLLDGNVPRSVLGTQGAPVPVTPPHGPQSPRPCKRRRLLAWLRFLLLTIRIALGLAAQLKFA